MPTGVKQKRPTVAQRATEATQSVAEYLRLEDQKRAAAALAEVAAEVVRRDPTFAARVRGVYEDMALPPPTRSTSGRGGGKTSKVAADVHLIPIKYIPGYEADSAAPPDPYLLLEMYGREQLPLAIGRYETADLREAVKLVKAHNSKTKPAGTGRQALIDYILEYAGKSV